ncbi:hypothetical protein HYS96_03105 [Candidatus Daviesbacteria bacterium]|nr:hypothetical protein [Candidatus Daviesbacteria bacterium]
MEEWLNSFIKNPLIAYPVGALIGIIGTLSLKFVDVWVDGIKEDQRRRKTRKLEAAKDIIEFVIYGMHNGFKWKAKSEKEIKIRAQEIEAFDIEVGKKLKEFLINWSMYRGITKNKTPEFIEAVNTRKYSNKAQELGQELLEVAKEWAK